VTRLRAVLFDAAGTLIEPAEPVGETYARVFAGHGARIPAWRLEDAFARVMRGAPPLAFPGEPPARVPDLERRWWRDRVRETLRAADSEARLADPDAAFEELFARFARPEAWRLRPGAREALASLRAAGLATAVVSNFDGRLPGILEGLGLGVGARPGSGAAPPRLLDAVVLPADAGCAKPDPRIFHRALARLGGIEPAAALHVGDDPERDLAGARRAGLRAFDVGRVATLAELPRHLAGLPACEAGRKEPAP